jgi:hypothetical protein
MNIIIRWSQASPHFAAAEKRCCKMLEMGWREFLESRTRMLRQVVSHLTLRLPHHKRVCVSQVDAVPMTNDGPILGPRNVELDGLIGWRPSRYEVRQASIRQMCVTTGTSVNAPSRTMTNPSQYRLLVPNALSYAKLPRLISLKSSSTHSKRLFFSY